MILLKRLIFFSCLFLELKINFGFKNKGKESNIIEVDAYGNQVFNLTITNSAKDMTYVYRAYRMQFYPDNYVFDATK